MISEEKLLNAGLCALVSVDGNDLSPVEAARTSYRDLVDAHTPEENENLVDYLIRKKHSTPLEFAEATFYMVMPIFVARQMVRHRTVCINEESLRYVEAREDFYIPETNECKVQSRTNKQGSADELVANPEFIQKLIKDIGDANHSVYQTLLANNLSKEISRTVLPLGQYTAWYWKANLRNIFGLLELRLDPHAQAQIRVYAESMLKQLEPYFPFCIKAWKNHVLNAVIFSADEWDCIKDMLHNYNDLTETQSKRGYVLSSAKVLGIRETRLKEFKEKLYK